MRAKNIEEILGSQLDNSCVPRPGGIYVGNVTVTEPKSIIDEAKEIVEGVRRENYGPPEDNFAWIGIKWGVTLGIIAGRGWKPGDPVPAEIVALMMVDLKTTRQAFQRNRDNSVDIVGYAYAESRLKSNGWNGKGVDREDKACKGPGAALEFGESFENALKE